MRRNELNLIGNPLSQMLIYCYHCGLKDIDHNAVDEILKEYTSHDLDILVYSRLGKARYSLV